MDMEVNFKAFFREKRAKKLILFSFIFIGGKIFQTSNAIFDIF
jgi:hypothetical protein